MFGQVVPELFKKQSNFNKHLNGFVPHCTSVLNPKPAPSMADLVRSRFPNCSRHSLPIFRPFLVLWRWMEVCSVPLLYISLLICSFIRLYHSTHRKYGRHSPADFRCQCDRHVICSTCRNGSSPLFTRTWHGSQLHCFPEGYLYPWQATIEDTSLSFRRFNCSFQTSKIGPSFITSRPQ